MSYLYQPETNVAAHRMSSAEAAKWRDSDVDPELLYSDLLVREAIPEQRHPEELRPLSSEVAVRVMQAADVHVQDPATAAVNLSFNIGRL